MSAHDVTQTHNCKYPGCENESRSNVGRYSYCEKHRGAGAALKAAKGSNANRLREAIKLARRVDTARARAEVATRKALELKDKADELDREFHVQLRTIMGVDQS